MKNPWLNIPADDYEGHMSEVGQQQLLNRITGEALALYHPESLAVFGCATGNGLENVDNAITKQVYAIDINPEYLQVVEQQYTQGLDGLTTVQLDLDRDDLPFTGVNLAIAALILEYVDPGIVLPKMVSCLHRQGKLVVVIQEDSGSGFVSPTGFHSLRPLSGISKRVDSTAIQAELKALHMELMSLVTYPLPHAKSFISMVFQKST